MKPPDPTHKSATPRTRHEKPATCRGCSAEWFGTAVCHCGACHRTFTGVTAFDVHRRGGTCQAPEGVGLVLNELGRWGGEPMTDEAIAARRGTP